MKIQPRPEPLEARIAPATFLVSASELLVTDASIPGVSVMDQPNETNSAGNVGVDFAFLMGATDQLVFDSNHNGNLDATDRRLVQIEAGNAMIFLNDRDGDG